MVWKTEMQLELLKNLRDVGARNRKWDMNKIVKGWKLQEPNEFNLVLHIEPKMLIQIYEF